jgi:TP901-1 family phage major tail protein
MPVQKGRDFLLKVGTGGPAVTVGAMRTTRFTVNGEAVDVTNKDSAGWRELLAGAGKASVTVQASGLLSGNAQASDFVSRVIAKSLDAYTVIFDNGDKLEGSFQCASFEAAGEHDGEQTYSLTLESAGAITLTAV